MERHLFTTNEVPLESPCYSNIDVHITSAEVLHSPSLTSTALQIHDLQNGSKPTIESQINHLTSIQRHNETNSPSFNSINSHIPPPYESSGQTLQQNQQPTIPHDGLILDSQFTVQSTDHFELVSNQAIDFVMLEFHVKTNIINGAQRSSKSSGIAPQTGGSSGKLPS